MFYEKLDEKYILRLEINEKLHETLIQFAKKNNIRSGYYNGMGALKNVELGFYHLHKKEYQKKIFLEEYELTCLMGNLTLFEEKVFPHSHVSLSDKNFNMIGGHLFEAEVAVAVEIFLFPIDKPIYRKQDDKIGLKSLDLKEIS